MNKTIYLTYKHNNIPDKVFNNWKHLNPEYKIDFSWGGSLAITINRLPSFGTLLNDNLIYAHGYSGHGLALSTFAGKLICDKISGKPDKFNFISNIKNFSILGGDLFRRPIYTSAVSFYKFQDMLKLINR